MIKKNIVLYLNEMKNSILRHLFNFKLFLSWELILLVESEFTFKTQ